MNEDKEKMLKLTTDQIESKFGKGSIMTLGEGGADLNIGVIPTGALPLDAALGIGGVPRGRIIEIYGPESSGKTTLALQILAEAQALGGIVAFIDAEHALDPVYAARIGVDIDEVLISQPDTGEQALEICDMLVRSGAIDCVIVDSVAALVPRAEIEGEMGDTTVGLQARLMSQALRKLAGSLSKSNTTCIFINQLREKIGVMFGNPETTTGGRALKFFSSVRIDIRRIDSIKQNGDVVGNRVRAKVVKNKVAPPFRQAEFDLMYGEGISREGCIVDMAVECGVAKKSGAWYTYGEERLGQGREAAKQTLKENPDLREETREQGPRGLRDPRHRAPGRKRVVHAGAKERQEEIALSWRPRPTYSQRSGRISPPWKPPLPQRSRARKSPPGRALPRTTPSVAGIQGRLARRTSSHSSRGEERESALSDEEGKTARDAYQKILRWAAVRERSTAYLRERLLKDDFPSSVVEEALQRAVRVRAVDDRRYADALVRMKLAAGRGLRDAEREIEELGIDPATLDSWVEHERKGRDFEVGRALAALRRRPPKAKRAREAAFRRLVSQGFSTDIAATASRTWSEEQERSLMCGSMGHS